MRLIKHTLYLIALLVMLGFYQCSSAQKLQEKALVNFGEVYYQTWNAGVKEGGSGTNVFITVKEDKIVLDSIYFRGQGVKLERLEKDALVYVGRFKSIQNKDIVLSSEMNEEHKNQLPYLPSQLPFKLENDECVITYKQHEKTNYYKISNIIEKPTLNYPSPPPKKD